MAPQRVSILLVDDDPSDIEIAKTWLVRHQRNFEVDLDVVQSGREAVGRAMQKHYDAMLLDLNLQDMDGLEVLKKVKQERIDVPVVVVTGAGSQVLAVESMKAGAYDYVTKDQVAMGALTETLRHVLERRRREREAAEAGERERQGALREGIDKVYRVLERSGLRVSEGRARDLINAVVTRARETGYVSIDKYCERLALGGSGDQEFKELVKVLTVGETYFFRTPGHMWAFRDDLLPQIVETRQRGLAPGLRTRPITIWSAGCSTGEEAYSLAMIVKERETHFQGYSFKIIATDINEDALNVARIGIYDKRAVTSTPRSYLERYFISENGQYAVSNQIKAMVEFKYHNLLEPEFPSPIGAPNSVDVIFCRNVLIYFSNETGNDIARRFLDVLVPGGFLVIGHSESLDRTRSGFETIFCAGTYLYRKPLEPKMSRKVALRAAGARAPGEQVEAARGLQDRQPPKPSTHAAKDRAQALTEEARSCADRGDYETALRKGGEAIELDPQAGRAYYVLGLVHWAKGETWEAIRRLSRAVDLEKDSALPRYYLAEAYRRAGQAEKALELYRETVKILQRLPEDGIISGSDGVTNSRLAEACRTAMSRLEARS